MATLVGTFAPVLDLKIYLLLHFVIVLLIEVSVPSSASVHSTDRPTCEVIENLVSFFRLQLLFIRVTVVCVASSLLIPILHLIVIRTKVVMCSPSILVHVIDFLIDIIFVLEEHLVSHLLVLLLILLVSLDARLVSSGARSLLLESVSALLRIGGPVDRGLCISRLV